MFVRILRAWRRHGPWRFFRLALFNVRYYAFRIFHSSKQAIDSDSGDETYGTETTGIREIGSLDVTVEDALDANRYQPSGASLARRLISDLRIDFRAFTFVDYGSGKGRVMMIAAEFPFRKILGVEFSRELHLTAVANITRLPEVLMAGGRMQSCHTNAREFEPPPTDLVCYFYNPFGPTVIERVAERLCEHAVAGHRVIIIYVDPHHRELFQKSGVFETREAADSYVIFDTHRG